MKQQLLQKYFFIVSVCSVAFITCQYKYPIVDTDQTICYNDETKLTYTPTSKDSFFGQDCNYKGNSPSYRNNGDGTITDLVTGLMWQQSADMNGDGKIDSKDKMFYEDAINFAATFSLGGYKDWRLASIKELYSLIIFTGVAPSPEASSTVGYFPFINTEFFNFGWGDTANGERVIDAQYATSTLYVSQTMISNPTMFGVNFADGRIKGYPYEKTTLKKYYVKYVRGNSDYGKNEFIDNNDGTMTDNGTGLMWMKSDSGIAMTWQEALSYAESYYHKGYMDWRLPNVKELHSLVDYTQAPAINSAFSWTRITNEAMESDYPYYWSSTTHVSESQSDGKAAAYICFGKCLGYMSNSWMDVHGAGAQRSDPKIGSASDYPTGRGPQGDAIRINNYVRLVRGGTAVSTKGSSPTTSTILIILLIILILL